MLNYKNPKITERNISFRNFILSKKNGFHLRIAFGADSPFFECKKIYSETLSIKGGLIQNPICELPKFGFFKNFWTHECNRCDMSISQEMEVQNLETINRHYKTSYKFQNLDRKKIFGLFKLIPERNRLGDWLYGNFLSIYHSYGDYILHLYDYLQYQKKGFIIDIAVQKINEWESWPIVDMSLNSDYSEIIKDEFFDSASTIDEFPRTHNLLYK